MKKLEFFNEPTEDIDDKEEMRIKLLKGKIMSLLLTINYKKLAPKKQKRIQK